MTDKIKDFFVNFNGKEMYDKLDYEGDKLPEVVKESKKAYSPKMMKKSIDSVEILFPFNERKYKSSGYFETDPKKFTKPGKDLQVNVYKEGIVVYLTPNPSTSAYNSLFHIIPKYKKTIKVCQVLTSSRDAILFIFSVPSGQEGYNEIVSILTEYAVTVRTFLSYETKVMIQDRSKFLNPKDYSEKNPSQKGFSLTPLPTGISLALGALGLGHILASVKIQQAFHSILEKNKIDPPGLHNKLIGWVKKQGDIIYINLGPSDFFIDIRSINKSTRDILINSPKFDADDPRSIDDYLKKGLIEGKNAMICYSDLSCAAVMAHEIGHYIISKKKFLNMFQSTNSPLGWLSKSPGILSFIGFVLGITGQGIIAAVTLMAAQSPLLIKEFMASYYGLELLKELGVSEQDRNTMKKAFRGAFLTYLNSSVGKVSFALLALAAGAVTRAAIKESGNK